MMLINFVILILLMCILGMLVYIAFFKKRSDCLCQPNQPINALSAQSSSSIDIIGLDGEPKDWILMLKLGAGEDNCIESDGAYSCNFLYADNENQSLQLVDDFKVDSEDDRNPAYQLYKLCQTNNYISWNDQGSEHSCTGANGYAHDKGCIVYNDNEGVYCQSSNPNWGFFSKGFKDSGKARHSGIQTNLAQHLMFVKLGTSSDIKNMVNLMNQANVCIMEGGIEGYMPCVQSNNCSSSYISTNINGVKVIAKPKGSKGDDVWGYLNENQCSDKGMEVFTFCVPTCPRGKSEPKDPINGITDVMNINHGKDSVLNTDCGLDFSAFKANHSKIGVCSVNNKVIVGGNNHSVDSQGPRGGLFVVIDSSSLSSDFKCLFKDY